MTETWFLTFRGDRRGYFVRIEAPSKDHARIFAVDTYDDMDELLDDLTFNPALHLGGELDHVRIEPS